MFCRMENGASFGSPPRARGEQSQRTDATLEARITPACAGRTTARSRGARWPWDHPRVRGENALHDDDQERPVGSPPRARGEHPTGDRITQHRGITPACAGRTITPGSSSSRARDHPRVRGENLNRLSPECTVYGSPPRARGERQLERDQLQGFGITPACAGRTTPLRRFRDSLPDHPRVRGENSDRIGHRERRFGSPPRARGEHRI